MVLKISWIALLCSVITVTVCAQSLPNKQAISVLAPKGIKIDGKLDEWRIPLEAYNNATQIFYTIANDSDNLYLVIQATEPDIISRVNGGGIAIGIQKRQ